MLRRLAFLLRLQPAPSPARLARARQDLTLALSLPMPACLPPLERAIATLERMGDDAQANVMLGRALRRMADLRQGKLGVQFRARAVAKLQAQLERKDAPRFALWLALAEAWGGLPDEGQEDEASMHRLVRQLEARRNALGFAADGAQEPERLRHEAHLAQAATGLSYARHPLCPDPLVQARLAYDEVAGLLAEPVLPEDLREAGLQLQTQLKPLIKRPH